MRIKTLLYDPRFKLIIDDSTSVRWEKASISYKKI